MRNPLADPITNQQANVLFEEHQRSIFIHTDRMFAVLMTLQYLGGIAAALWLSPKTWAGQESSISSNVWAAIFLGGAISALPIGLALTRAGHVSTRFVIAVAQMMMSALLIHLTGGRIETHFHVFGSLAFLAAYRDWRVLIPATVVVAVDHMVRGIFWPESVYGVIASQNWRWVEHAFWVLFEDTFLYISIKRSVSEMWDIACRTAEIRNLNEHLEERVAIRTTELEASNANLETEVAARKFAEERLSVFNQKLQQSNRELQDFAYVASHDLQEPLRKVQAFSERLKTKYGEQLEGDGLDYLERMRNAAERMQMLIQDLLRFSRVSTMAQPFASVELETVTREVLSDLEVKIEETGATVEVSDLPTIQADKTQMRQLLQNLIGNALKFRKPDAAPIVNIYSEKVSSNGNGSNGHFKLCVQDNGIGFDEKYVDKIFAVFQRLHGRNEYEGSGVGLAVCRKIVERHHGKITAKSEPGEGTTFVITLPLKQVNTESTND